MLEIGFEVTVAEPARGMMPRSKASFTMPLSSDEPEKGNGVLPAAPYEAVVARLQVYPAIAQEAGSFRSIQPALETSMASVSHMRERTNSSAFVIENDVVDRMRIAVEDGRHDPM